MTTQLISDVSVPSKMTNECMQNSIVNRVLTIASSLDRVGTAPHGARHRPALDWRFEVRQL